MNNNITNIPININEFPITPEQFKLSKEKEEKNVQNRFKKKIINNRKINNNKFIRICWNQITNLNNIDKLSNNNNINNIITETHATKIPIEYLKPKVIPNDNGLREKRDFMKELQKLRKGRRRKGN